MTKFQCLICDKVIAKYSLVSENIQTHVIEKEKQNGSN